MLPCTSAVVLFSTFILAVQGLQWTSSSTLPDSMVLKVCRGQNVTVAWTYASSNDEHLMDVEWYFKAEGQAETLLATKTAGFFLKAPTSPQTLAFMPNAGLQFYNVQAQDSGRYTVKVNMNVHGSIVDSHQTLLLNVSDAECQTEDNRVSDLKSSVNQLESENMFLKSRLEQLEQFPAVKDYMERPGTCVNVQAYDSNNAIHTLHMADGVTFPVFCDQSGSGGWTVLQRRFDGSIEFYRNWQDYEDGFGSLNGEFWIGLEKLHRMTRERPNMLRVEMEDFANHTAYAEYRNFSVGNYETLYTLTITGYSGDAGDSMADINGAKFSTFDKENDAWSLGQCAEFHHGGWWYRQCTKANLNGMYLGGAGAGDQDIFWETFQQGETNLKRVEMKMKPV